jgi:septation ring formation regulator EzrA
MTRIPLDDYVLSHLNVTSRGRSLGLLRDGGKLNYPSALQGLMTETQRRDLDARAQAIVQAAVKGKRDANALKDVRTEIEQFREQLRRKVNETSSGPYLEAMRFLNDFDDATAAIESGDAASQFDFQKMITDSKVQNLNELVNLMVDRGWQFAPALQVDESAYRALHSGLVAYDIALNSSVATAAEPKE